MRYAQDGTGNTGTTDHATYWLASRCVEDDRDYYYFSMFRVYSGTVDANHLFNSHTSTNKYSNAVRPVVDMDLSRVYIGVTGTGESSSPYSIQAR